MLIRTEHTPNPSTRKFLPGQTVMESGTRDFPNVQSAQGSGLAQALFDTEMIEGVFYGRDFISVTAAPGVSWTDLEPEAIRLVVEGKLRVFRSRDAGHSWQPVKRGLPQENAWVTVLRDAMDQDDLEPVGLYFGTSTGHVFSSRDRGESWKVAAEYLPKILCVSVA